MKIKIYGEIKIVKLLHMFYFNSDRKRMSIIIENEGVIKMYIKGADNMIKDRLAPN